MPVSGPASCASGDPAQLTSTADLFPPDGLGPQTARDASGNFHTTYAIPPAARAGTYSIGVRCGGGSVGISATLQVTQTTTPTPTTTTVASTTTSSTSTTVAPTSTAPGPTTTPPRAARTSNDNSRAVWIVLGALALLVAAGAAVFVRRRRRAGASS